MRVLSERRCDLGWVWSLIVAMTLAFGLLFVVLWFASAAGAAEQRSLFIWTSNAAPGEVEQYHLILSEAPGAAAAQEFDLDAPAARAYPVPSEYPLQDCGAEVIVHGDGVKTYWFRIRAEAAGKASAWSAEATFTWNFLQTPTDLIVVDVNGPTADVKIYRRYADGARKLKLFYYGGG